MMTETNKENALLLIQQNEQAVHEELQRGLNNLNRLILEKLPETLQSTETPIHPAVNDVLMSISSTLGYTVAIANEATVLREGPQIKEAQRPIGFAAMGNYEQRESASTNVD